MGKVMNTSSESLTDTRSTEVDTEKNCFYSRIPYVGSQKDTCPACASLTEIVKTTIFAVDRTLEKKKKITVHLLFCRSCKLFFLTDRLLKEYKEDFSQDCYIEKIYISSNERGMGVLERIKHQLYRDSDLLWRVLDNDVYNEYDQKYYNQLVQISKCIKEYAHRYPYVDIVSYEGSLDWSIAERIACKASKMILLPNCDISDQSKNYLVCYSEEERLLSASIHSLHGISGYGVTSYRVFGHQVIGRVADITEHFAEQITQQPANGNLILTVSKALTEVFRPFGSLKEFFSKTLYDMEIYRSQHPLQIAQCIGDVKLEMVQEGLIVPKWKNEYNLYLAVKELFPDAIFQYQPTWLKPQSLDIFIPSLNLAIEYQGQQHYEAVSIFGGEEKVAETKRRDRMKKQKCKRNNCKLLEWKYTEKVVFESVRTAINSFLDEHH